MIFARTYPVEDDALIRQLWNEGLPASEIARRMGRSVNSVEGAVRRLCISRRSGAPRIAHKSRAKRARKPVAASNPYRKPQPAPVTLSPRSCLSCRTSFPSFGIGNRICDPCKRHEAWA